MNRPLSLAGGSGDQFKQLPPPSAPAPLPPSALAKQRFPGGSKVFLRSNLNVLTGKKSLDEELDELQRQLGDLLAQPAVPPRKPVYDIATCSAETSSHHYETPSWTTESEYAVPSDIAKGENEYYGAAPEYVTPIGSGAAPPAAIPKPPLVGAVPSTICFTCQKPITGEASYDLPPSLPPLPALSLSLSLSLSLFLSFFLSFFLSLLYTHIYIYILSFTALHNLSSFECR